MKNLYILPLAFSILLTSCGSNESAIEELQHEAEMVVENGADDIYEFNDALLSEMTIIEVEFAKIYDLDDQNVSEEEFSSEAKKSLDVIDGVQENLAKIEPYGSGKGFLDAVVDYANQSETVMNLYLDYSKLLSIPDLDWSDEQLDEFIEVFEPAEKAHSDTYDRIGSEQDTFANLNGTSVEDEASFDAQEIYEETKEK
tara:strand:- start:362 stop:958 length:597 start_codon:yes stop_codon:yes gene_type:complete